LKCRGGGLLLLLLLFPLLKPPFKKLLKSTLTWVDEFLQKKVELKLEIIINLCNWVVPKFQFISTLKSIAPHHKSCPTLTVRGVSDPVFDNHPTLGH
jgi:hypothetical protein